MKGLEDRGPNKDPPPIDLRLYRGVDSSGCPVFLSGWLINPSLACVSMLSLKLQKHSNVQLKCESVNLAFLHFSTFFPLRQSQKCFLFAPAKLER